MPEPHPHPAANPAPAAALAAADDTTAPDWTRTVIAFADVVESVRLMQVDEAGTIRHPPPGPGPSGVGARGSSPAAGLCTDTIGA